jgi:hypothetical protein
MCVNEGEEKKERKGKREGEGGLHVFGRREGIRLSYPIQP